MNTHFKRNWFWYTLILLLAAGNVYFYLGKQWAIQHTQTVLDEERVASTEKIANIVEQNEVEQLKSQCSFYAHLLSNDLIDKSWNDAREKMGQIVRHTYITEIDYVFNDGEIKIATNKNKEGTNGKKSLPANLFSAGRSIPVHTTDLGHVASVPIYDGETLLGRLLIFHSKATANVPPI